MKPRKKRNPGWFKKGKDARRSSYRPTREECQKGYRAAEAKMMDRGWDAYAWWRRQIRGYYSKKGA